jgi:exodeoxyribonuclease-3
MPLTIATWNINSVRLRAPIVARFLEQYHPDILCLQETKCPDDQFPSAPFRKLGYEHIHHRGQKGYHGVATLSRLPARPAGSRDFCNKGDARHAAVVIDTPGGELTLHNFYVPAGGDEPDPEVNPKFAHKLAFIEEMASCLTEQRAKGPGIAVGDFNIAPLENDVWSHKQLLRVVSHTPVETEGLNRMQAAGEWIDVMRHFVPPEEKLYTWWSYRNHDWALSNRGRRLDHVWATPDLVSTLTGVEVVRDARNWPQPSDHVPVIGRFAIG